MESFTASLLQDMAIPLLVRSRGEAYNQVLNQWHARGGDLDDLEREQFPWDHSEVGSWMCASWDLPEPLAMAIHAHHSDHPDLGEECPPAVALVGFLREGDMEEGVDELIEKAGLWYGLTEEKCRELLDESFRRAEELVSLLV